MPLSKLVGPWYHIPNCGAALPGRDSACPAKRNENAVPTEETENKQ